MKKLLITAAAAAGLLGAGLFFSPANADDVPEYAGANCGYATTHTTVAGQEVGVQAGEDGMPGGGAANNEVGACLNAPAGNGIFEGGAAGVGAGQHACVAGTEQPAVPGAYVIADGDNQNFVTTIPTTIGGNPVPPPFAGQNIGITGYIGISTYEDTNANDIESGNNANDGAPGSTNSGCRGIGIKGTGTAIPLPIACGFTSGPDWAGTQRDGCWIP